MLDLLTTQFAPFFTVPAVLGTAFFAIRLALLLVGAADADLDLPDAHGDITDLVGGDPHHTDPGEAFKYLSLQSLLAFAMGFGWTGLVAYRSLELSPAFSILVGMGGGVAMVWLLALLMKGMHDLQSSGNVDPRHAVGYEGEMYVGIPSSDATSIKRGQVRVTINDRQRIYDAVEDALTGTEPLGIPTGTRVRIVGIDGGHTLRVVKV